MSLNPPTKSSTGNVDPSLFAGLAGDLTGNLSDTRPPIVLLHGLTYDRAMWTPTLTQLRRIDPDRRVLTLDLPGHGQSVENDQWGMLPAMVNVHEAVKAVGFKLPIMVGHSLSGIMATLYAAAYPTGGAVNVDASLNVEPFQLFLRSIVDQIRGPQFADVWQGLTRGFHIERLPQAAQQLLEGSTTPRQDLFLAYQHDLLEGPLGRLPALLAMALGSVRGSGVPYLVVAGDEQPAGYVEWVESVLPQATFAIWPDSGHFPPLAHPERFAIALQSTEDWSPPAEHSQGP